ncbi:MAG: class A beta-lactamase [Rhodanobacteraceae bacterium]
MNRRTLLKNVALIGATSVLRPAWALAADADDAAARLSALERRHGGRLGVSMLDTGTGRRVSHRGDERFLMCSTFKLLAVAAVLARVDGGKERLDRRIVFGKEDLLPYAPVTRRHVGAPGMTVAELCQAAITLSDNTAANLLLASLDGPPAVTAFARRLGDRVTRLDRTEPELNVGAPGDTRDTTTPNAMLGSLHAVLLDDALSDASRAQLLEWLRACTTGKERLRASLPDGWRVGDKTGSGPHAETNDIAIIWPPKRKPLLVASYYAESTENAASRNKVLAEVGRVATSI